MGYLPGEGSEKKRGNDAPTSDRRHRNGGEIEDIEEAHLRNTSAQEKGQHQT